MKKNLLYFTLIALAYLSLGVIQKNLLNGDELLIESLSEIYNYKQIEDFIQLQNKWQKFGYILLVIILLIKVLVISAIIDFGCFVFDRKIQYVKLFLIVVKAESVFLLPIIFKTVWFYFFQTNYNLEDLQYFYPLSTLNIIGYEGLQPWFIYPFQVLNLFELAYWFILAYLIGKELNENTDKSFSIVASSYGVSLLIWVVGVMFFTLNMS